MSFESSVNRFMSGAYLNPLLKDLDLTYNRNISPQTLKIGRVAIKALTNTAIAAVALLPVMIVGGPVTVAAGLTYVIGIGVITAFKAHQDESSAYSRFLRFCSNT